MTRCVHERVEFDHLIAFPFFFVFCLRFFILSQYKLIQTSFLEQIPEIARGTSKKNSEYKTFFSWF